MLCFLFQSLPINKHTEKNTRVCSTHNGVSTEGHVSCLPALTCSAIAACIVAASSITYAAPSGLNWSVTRKCWVNGKLTFSRSCSLPLRLSQGISIAALLCCARFILRVSVGCASIMEVVCRVRGCVKYPRAHTGLGK